MPCVFPMELLPTNIPKLSETLILNFERIEDHTFLSNNLNSRSVIVDLGGNKGNFSKTLRDKFKSRVYAVEPHPALYKKLLKLKDVDVFPAAIYSTNGITILYANKTRCASIHENLREKEPNGIRVRAITLDNFLKQKKLEKVDLLKVDIEGAEIEMFETLSPKILRHLKQITVEYHDFLDKSYLPQIETIHRKLTDLGFKKVRFSHFTHGDVLYLNRLYFRIGPWEWFQLYFYKYFQGIKRFILRKTGKF